jgi:hypothetical protein
VPQKPGLDVFDPKRFSEERIVKQIDLADREIIRRSPVSIHFLEQLCRNGADSERVSGTSCTFDLLTVCARGGRSVFD